MNKQLQQLLNSTLEHTEINLCPQKTSGDLQTRLSEELDWLDEDPGRACLIVLLQELAAAVRKARIVVSPGFGFLPDSYLLFLTGVTKVNPIEWDLPFSRFKKSVRNGAEIPFEAGSGCLKTAREILSDRENEMITETAPGLFEIVFLNGEQLKKVSLCIYEYHGLDQFGQTLKNGWHPLDQATLNLFRRGITDGSIWFESDVIRKWLFEFEPTSMSDLVLLYTLYYPGRTHLFEQVLANKRHPDYEPFLSIPGVSMILRETYGIPVYQEQVLLMAGLNDGKEPHVNRLLAPKGHSIARTMLSVEALWHSKDKTTLK